jgi:tetratricopeptide (TPR) repeat protein
MRLRRRRVSALIDAPGVFDMRTPSRVLILAIMLCGAGAALAAGSGPSGMSQPTRVPEPRTPEQEAAAAYNEGVRAVKKADKAALDAARATDARKQAKIAKRASDGYSRALAKFEDSIALAPHASETWNYIGYTKRNLGDYEGALQAYDKALAIAPGFAQAIEYRGQAYLKLSRLEDAKNAYLQLYAGNRELSNQLLTAMRDWIGAQRAGTPSDPAALDEFARWVDERVAIAAQTASLTREGAAAGWN